MVNASEAGAPVDDHVCQFDFQPGWVDLMLEKFDWGEAWAVATVVAATQFDSAELNVKSRTLIRDLRKRALSLNRDEPLHAAAYYTPDGRGMVDFRFDTYVDEGKPRPSPPEVVPLLLEYSDAEVVGQPDIRYLDLAVGPAVRIQAELKNKSRRLGFGRDWMAGLVKYAVFPPGLDSLGIVKATWWKAQDAEEATRLIDALVATMRLIPVDADGNEVESP